MSSTNVIAPVGTNVPSMKRSIQMGHFRSDTAIAAVLQTKQPVTLGQVVGTVYDVKQRENVINGQVARSYQAIGEFEAIVYASGEVLESGSAYLPNYFLETVKASIDSGAASHGVTFAIEVLMVPNTQTGGMSYAYEVRNLAQRNAESPLQAMKRQLQASGTLRLTPPLPLLSGSSEPAFTFEVPSATQIGDDAAPDASSDAPDAGKKPARK